MDKTTQIRSLLRAIAGTDRPSFSFRLMEVVGVDGDLCRAKIDDFEIPDIRLSSIDGGSENGLLVVPAEGSIILVADISCGNLRELCAIGYSEVASIRFHQGDTTLTADGGHATVEIGDSKATMEKDRIELTVGRSTARLEKDRTELAVGASEVRIEDGGIRFNDGANHGLVKVEELTIKLNTLEQEINDLKSVFLKWKPVPQDGGAALQIAASTWAGTQLNTTQRQELENDKITH